MKSDLVNGFPERESLETSGTTLSESNMGVPLINGAECVLAACLVNFVAAVQSEKWSELESPLAQNAIPAALRVCEWS